MNVNDFVWVLYEDIGMLTSRCCFLLFFSVFFVVPCRVHSSRYAKDEKFIQESPPRDNALMCTAFLFVVE